MGTRLRCSANNKMREDRRAQVSLRAGSSLTDSHRRSQKALSSPGPGPVIPQGAPTSPQPNLRSPSAQRYPFSPICVSVRRRKTCGERDWYLYCALTERPHLAAAAPNFWCRVLLEGVKSFVHPCSQQNVCLRERSRESIRHPQSPVVCARGSRHGFECV
ncbi:hypothetical protein Ddc_11868 [Ditylenchus destructor]|nr:hypothetical protein Ddc_11868 [Ditylenchus destructor]